MAPMIIASVLSWSFNPAPTQPNGEGKTLKPYISFATKTGHPDLLRNRTAYIARRTYLSNKRGCSAASSGSTMF